MIKIKNKQAIEKMKRAGQLIAHMFDQLIPLVVPGVSTLDIDNFIDEYLKSHELTSQTKGYKGYGHVSCVSVNDEVVHGVPYAQKILKAGDLVKVDVCASWRGYCADMARCYIVGQSGNDELRHFVAVAQQALDKGIEKAMPGNYLTDISANIQKEIERHGYGVVRDFAGHGIGKHMHEDPELLNYGAPGQGPRLRAGMTLAIEPMITMGDYRVYVDKDGWTVKTKDKSLAAHVEDTVVITEHGPQVLTRISHAVKGAS